MRDRRGRKGSLRAPRRSYLLGGASSPKILLAIRRGVTRDAGDWFRKERRRPADGRALTSPARDSGQTLNFFSPVRDVNRGCRQTTAVIPRFTSLYCSLNAGERPREIRGIYRAPVV